MKSSRVGPTSEPASIAVPISSLEQVNWQAQQIELAIARRAYELFQARGGEHGHDWEDWFQAEAELLRPVPVVWSESSERLTICANVLGFSAADLQVAIEPRRVLILGERKTATPDAYPDQILCSVELKSEVVPELAKVYLKTGVLRFELFKVRQMPARPAA